MNVYVAHMCRWGDQEKHSYILGVFSTKEKALEAGDIEGCWRGGKYEVKVTANTIDYLKEEKIKTYENTGLSVQETYTHEGIK